MNQHHTVLARCLFRSKRLLLQSRRGLANLLNPPSTLAKGDLLPFVAIEIETPLRPIEDKAEYLLTLGKIQNLRLATRCLDRLRIEEGQVFSFWAVLGRLTRRRGYVVGREVRQGCIIPSVGGGICQLSNAIYQAALATGCEIIERHRHSMVVPGSDVEQDRDATVAWNDIDLRFRAPRTLQIECFLTDSKFVLRFRSSVDASPKTAPSGRTPLRIVGANSCVTCGQESCSQHSPDLKFLGSKGKTWIMDRHWPEWESTLEDGSRLLVPRRGPWPQCETVPVAAALRSARVRLVRNRPPATVRKVQLDSDQNVALALARKLTYEEEELVVALSLAPALWQAGVLQGRRYSIAVDRAPLRVLQKALDSAAGIEPESATLRDFRADAQYLEWEDLVLKSAQHLFTPHAGLATMFPNARLLEWVSPPPYAGQRNPSRLIVFPGPATARSGSKVVREVARELGLQVMVLGSMLEDPSLWEGIELVPLGEWKSRALAVVQPSVFTNRPEKLLQAQSAGVPVAAGPLCGLPSGTFCEIPFGDASAIQEFLTGLISPEPLPANSSPSSV